MKKLLYFTIGSISFIYLLTLKGAPGNNTVAMNTPPFETSMERGRFVQTVSLIENHTFTVDRYREYLSPDIAWYNGHFYPPFPPGVSFISAPAYLLGTFFNLGQIFATMPTTAISILTAIIIIHICLLLGFDGLAAAIAAIIYSLGTVAFPYSVSLSAHPFSAFATAVMFYLYLKIKKNPTQDKYLFLLWLVFGLNLFIDYPNLAITAPLAGLGAIKAFGVSIRKRHINIKHISGSGYAITGLVLALLPFFAYNYIHFGKPVAFTNTYNLKRLDIQGVKYTYATLSNSLFAQKNYAGRFNPRQLINGLNTLLISEDRGVFVYSPILLFMFPGLFLLWRKSKETAVAVSLVFLINLIVYGSFDDPWGGWGFGPRYLIVTLPFAAILAGQAFNRLAVKTGVLQLIFFGLLTGSIGINLLGALTTNAVPPGVEAVGLKMKDNFLLNYDILNAGQSGSFVFRQFFSKSLTPVEYGIMVFGLIVMALVMLKWFIADNAVHKNI